MFTLYPLYLLPFQATLFVLGLLAFIGIQYAERRRTAALVPARHRLADRTEPFRDWADIAAERLNGTPEPVEPVIEYDPLDHRIPLDEVERQMRLLDIAGHDDHAADEDATRELATV